MMRTAGGGCVPSKHNAPVLKDGLLGYHLTTEARIDTGRQYVQTGLKPVGLWYSMEKDTWQRYLVDIGIVDDNTQMHLHTLKLKPGQTRCSIQESGGTNKKILSITSAGDVELLMKNFGVDLRTEEYAISFLNSAKLAQRYAGIEIMFDCSCPGQHFQEHRLQYDILQLFDVCSGCIWDLSILEYPTEPEPVTGAAMVEAFVRHSSSDGGDDGSSGAVGGAGRRLGAPPPSTLAGTLALSVSLLVIMASSLAGAVV